MFVAVLGLGMFSGLGLLTVLIMPQLPNPNDLRPAQPHSGPHPVYLTIRSSLGEKITGVTVDGTPAFVTSLGAGMCQLQVQPGPHAIVVAFESSDPKNYERSYSTKVDGRMMEAIEIEAVPVYRPVIQGSVQAIPPTLGASGDGTDNTSGDMTRPAGSSGNATSAKASNAPEDNITANNSIPLGDAVEVLTDPETMPTPAILHHAVGFQPNVQVWIDEPGLLIRLKQLDFEGAEKSGPEFRSSQAWGVDAFEDANGVVSDLQPGRYRVLVQDLEYGWELDRRGTIAIGQGKQMIHVRRSFAGQEIIPKEYPINLRWAGKSYQLTTAGQVAGVNHFFSILSGESPQTFPGASCDSLIWGIPTSEPTSEPLKMSHLRTTWHLKYRPRKMKLEIPTGLNVQSVAIMSDRGEVKWDRSVTDEFHIPSGPLF